MTPQMQTKVVIKNSKGEEIVKGNCYAAAIASLLDLPIAEVPNVEVLFGIDNVFWQDVMARFLETKGFELETADDFRVFHDGNYALNEKGNFDRERLLYQLRKKDYLVWGQSPRGISHVCIYNTGFLVHDPHPSKEGLISFDHFQQLIQFPQ